MPDEQMAVNEAVETPTQTSSPEVEAESTEQVETAAESQTAEPQADVIEGQGEQKSTRAERRVQQLLDKLKDKPQVQDLPLQQQQDLVDENEIDPTAVKFVDQRVQQATQQSVKQIRAELAYENAVDNHASDIEKSLEGLDPKIERLAVKQYQAMNYQINPFTGQEVFIPTAKFSEVVKSIQADLEDITASRVAEAGTNLARQAQESAVQPSGNTSERFSINDARKDIWRNPGKVAKELESRLNYSED